MTKQEIQEFIEQMESIGDNWAEEDVERVYDSRSLEDALSDRRAALDTFFNIIGTVINKG